MYCFIIILEIDSSRYLDNKEHSYLNNSFLNQILLKKSRFHAAGKFNICFCINLNIFNESTVKN